MPTINVGKRMKAEAYLPKGKGYDHFNVSKDAILEYTSRINDAFEVNMQRLCELAKAEGRKTVMERHVIQLFNYTNTATATKKDEEDE